MLNILDCIFNSYFQRYAFETKEVKKKNKYLKKIIDTSYGQENQKSSIGRYWIAGIKQFKYLEYTV